MKNILKTILLSLTLACTGTALAAVMSIPGGIVAPEKKFDIDLSSFFGGTFYKLVCNINATDSAKAYIGLDEYNSKNQYQFFSYLNGNFAGLLNDGFTATLKKGNNVFAINEIFRPSAIASMKIEVHNLDSKATLTITDCTATF